MYFNNFPNFLYEFNIKNKDVGIYLKDITHNIRFRRDVLSNITVYDEYDIMDNETPEIVAEKLYGNAEYNWIIMLANDRYDYASDFPLSYSDLLKVAQAKYIDINAIHHYENESGYVVNADYPLATPISNIQYEEKLNESKRRIKIIPHYLISKILSEYKAII